jgi:Flp pilus assembly protein TadB
MTRPSRVPGHRGARGRWSSAGPAPQRGLTVRATALPVAVGLAVAVVVGGWMGAVVGPVAGFAMYRWRRSRPTRLDAAQNRTIAADLPFVADLLAAALRAGAAPDHAAYCVGRAVSGPTGDRLLRVDRALRLGAGVGEAWSYLGDSDGALAIARAAGRSQQSGAAFAGALHRLADSLRSDILNQLDAAARRSGVLIVLPLGLCFLPAFVLTGLMPVIVAVLGDVLSQ